VIILLYGIPAALFLVRFRKTLLVSRPALVLMGMAMGFFVVAATSDVFKLPVEQISELLCSACVIAAVLLLGLSHVRLALEDLWAGHVPAEPSFRVFLAGAGGGNGSPTSESQSAIVSEVPVPDANPVVRP